MTGKQKVEDILNQIDKEHKAWLDFFSAQNSDALTKRLGSANWSAVDTLISCYFLASQFLKDC